MLVLWAAASMPRAAVATSAARAAASRACCVLRSPLVRRRALAVRGSGRMSRAQAYRAALVKCFFGSGSRAQAPVRRTGARKRRNASFAPQATGRAAPGSPACRRRRESREANLHRAERHGQRTSSGGLKELCRRAQGTSHSVRVLRILEGKKREQISAKKTGSPCSPNARPWTTTPSTLSPRRRRKRPP